MATPPPTPPAGCWGHPLTSLEADQAGPVGAGAFREDEDLWPLALGLAAAPDFLDGFLAGVGILATHQNGLRELDDTCVAHRTWLA